MSSDEPTLAEIVREAIDSRLLDVHVALPGRVEKYDETTQTADVLPTVRRAILDDEDAVAHEALPTVPNVPVLFPRSSTFSQTWELVKGDHVLLVFCSSAIGNWRETGNIADPGDLGRHELSYPIALPGIGAKLDTLPTVANAVLLEVTAPTTHVQVGAGATSQVALNDLVLAELVKIGIAITGLGGSYTPPAAAPFVGATKLKVE